MNGVIGEGHGRKKCGLDHPVGAYEVVEKLKFDRIQAFVGTFNDSQGYFKA